MHTRTKVSRALLGAAAAAAMAVPATAQAAPTPAAPAAAPPTTGFVKIQSQGDLTMCLQPTSANLDVPVVQEKCRPGLDLQDWQFQKLGSGPTYRFQNVASGGCLWAFEPDGGSPVGIEECGSSPFSNTEFNSGLNLPDSVFLESLIGFRHTGECLWVPPDAKSRVGVQMVVRPCQPADVSFEGWHIFHNAL
ncbi:RICIN domain-containing protein [Amycolatopsis sp. Hca4]|uniref:RICIN domain-containing protein n=1 Tax=Amycolatopsis sp. Hca4 TaxID=2742131 RepID=UPI001591FFC7|nr:RICIN domain-containing protein [Amycolatopsis sp. Hca4]QKV80374.1 RICIN domain-containing protein [Amycolatopsis sp. Hca4]